MKCSICKKPIYSDYDENLVYKHSEDDSYSCDDNVVQMVNKIAQLEADKKELLEALHIACADIHRKDILEYLDQLFKRMEETR